jgi:plasmid replication initiation protein
MLFCEQYTKISDFKKYVVEIAMHEINLYSDIKATYEFIKQCRAFTKISFIIKTKNEVDTRLMEEIIHNTLKN